MVIKLPTGGGFAKDNVQSVLVSLEIQPTVITPPARMPAAWKKQLDAKGEGGQDKSAGA
jgi:hypothetical protein